MHFRESKSTQFVTHLHINWESTNLCLYLVNEATEKANNNKKKCPEGRWMSQEKVTEEGQDRRDYTSPY